MTTTPTMKAATKAVATRAMVLAAGLGTRLRPMTDSRPKALVEIGGRTLLEITLARLRRFGITDVIVNAHHFADMLCDYLRAHDNFGLRIEVSREDTLLDTGGGLKKAAPFFLEGRKEDAERPFILHNVDVISTVDLGRMVELHNEQQALVTLAVHERESSRYLLFDDELRLCGRCAGRNHPPEIVRHSPHMQRLAFTGIHVISPRMLPRLTEEGAFSIIASYLRLAGEGERIVAFRADDCYWRDLGRPESVAQAARDIEEKGLAL